MSTPSNPNESLPPPSTEEKKESVLDKLLASGKTFQQIRKLLSVDARLLTRIFGQRVSKHDNKKRVSPEKRKSKRKAQRSARKATRKASKR